MLTSQASRGHGFYNSRVSMASCLCASVITWVRPHFLWWCLLIPSLGTEHWMETSRAGTPVAEQLCSHRQVSRSHQVEKLKVEQVAVCHDYSHLCAEGMQSPKCVIITTTCAWNPCKPHRIATCGIKAMHRARAFANLTGRHVQRSQPPVCGGHASISPQSSTV